MTEMTTPKAARVAPGQERYMAGLEAEGEPLLLPADAIALVSKFQNFSERTGIKSLRVSRLVSTPLVYDRSQRPSPQMIGHPLLWLPERLMQLIVVDGRVETPDHWSLRVVLELIMSGVYSEEYGWVDCLSLMGLDPQADAERIRLWCAGGEDEILDTFDLDDILLIEDDPDWSYDVASEMIATLTEVSIALTARSLALTAREALESPDTDSEGYTWNDADRIGVVTTSAALAGALLSDLDVPFEQMALAAREDTDPQMPGSACWQIVEVLERLDEEHKAAEEEAEALYEQAVSE